RHRDLPPVGRGHAPDATQTRPWVDTRRRESTVGRGYAPDAPQTRPWTDAPTPRIRRRSGLRPRRPANPTAGRTPRRRESAVGRGHAPDAPQTRPQAERPDSRMPSNPGDPRHMQYGRRRHNPDLRPRHVRTADAPSAQVRRDDPAPQLVTLAVHVQPVLEEQLRARPAVGVEHGRGDIDDVDVAHPRRGGLP